MGLFPPPYAVFGCGVQAGCLLLEADPAELCPEGACDETLPLPPSAAPARPSGSARFQTGRDLASPRLAPSLDLQPGESQITARLSGAEPAAPGTTKTVTVDLCSESFDARTQAKHEHGDAPMEARYWGPLNGALTACSGSDRVSCDLQVNDQGESEKTDCAIYRRGSAVLSGTATVRGAVRGNADIRATAPIDILVKGLGGGASSEYFRLTGSSGTTTYGKCPAHGIEHPSNHNALGDVWTNVQAIAFDFFNLTDGHQLGINDMSLPWGGLFDICGDWAPGHSLAYGHHIGTGVDIDTTAFNSETGLRDMTIDRVQLEVIAAEHHGVPAPEGTIHFTFPP